MNRIKLAERVAEENTITLDLEDALYDKLLEPFNYLITIIKANDDDDEFYSLSRLMEVLFKKVSSDLEEIMAVLKSDIGEIELRRLRINDTPLTARLRDSGNGKKKNLKAVSGAKR